MIQLIKSITLISLLVLSSTQLLAANFFTNLNEAEVQAIFDEADRSNATSYITNSSQKSIPALQILPKTKQPKYLVSPSTSCIKLYSCNDGICLVDIKNKKYVVSEPLIGQLSTKQTNTNSCNAVASTTNKTTDKKPAVNPNFSWVKIVNVKANDSLNIRQTTSYKSKKMGAAPYNGKCLKRYRCKGKWCEIKHQSVIGWVHKRFITKMTNKEQNQCF